MRWIAMLSVVPFLTACTLPGAGPTAGMITGSDDVLVIETEAEAGFALLPMSTPLAMTMNALTRPVRPDDFIADEPAPTVGVGTGDSLEVTIITINPAGFVDFSASVVRPISTNTLPIQAVDPLGQINVPPIGRVKVAGLGLPEIESRLQALLQESLIEPSVVVRKTGQVSDLVTVVGQVGAPGRHPALTAEARLMDVIATAGGPTRPAEELKLTLTRRGRSAVVGLEALLDDPRLNIRVWPGDLISVDAATSRYALLGAVLRPGRYDWAEPSFTLAEALAAGGGQLRQAADREGVYVLRRLPQEVLGEIGSFEAAKLADPAQAVLRFDFADASGLLAAQALELRDGDVVYVSDAPLEEFGKIVAAVRGVTGIGPERLFDAYLPN